MAKFLVTHTRQFIIEAENERRAAEYYWQAFDSFNEGSAFLEGEDRIEIEDIDNE